MACVKIHLRRPDTSWPICGVYIIKSGDMKGTDDPCKVDCRKCLVTLLKPSKYLLYKFKMNGTRWPGAWPKGYVRSHVEIEPLVL